MSSSNAFSDQSTLLAVSLGSYLIFHKYEPQRALPALFMLLVVPGALTWYNERISTFATFTGYWALLSLFTILYRVSPFHPLAQYPGPLLNKITKFRNLQIMRRGDLHRHHRALFQQHGDIVRVGPNELIYNNIEGVQSVLGPHGLPKGPFYVYGGDEPSLVNIRDPSEYPARRQLWNKAFSSSSLKFYEGNLIKRTRQLISGLKERKGKPVDIAKWMEYLAFDVMGDFCFNFPFEMTKSGCDAHGYRHTVIGSIQPLISLTQIPWLIEFVISFVDPGGPLKVLAKKMVNQRIEEGATAKDLFYHLSGGDGEAVKTNVIRLIDEGFAAIVAGSDTTSTALANLWAFLLQNPRCYERLKVEVDSTFPSGEEPFDQQKLSAMPYLNACLNETMRLIPPVPGGSQRSVNAGSGGKTLGSHFVPEGTNIYVHPYSMQRDPRYFSPYPDTFWPDRWLSPENRKSVLNIDEPFKADVDVVMNMTAFLAFSSGPRSCPGKNLALMELRMVAASIMQRFEMKVADGFDLMGWENTLEDYFVIKKGALPVNLTARV